MISKLFSKGLSRHPGPRVPDDLRVYAIGDIHGCDEAFAALLARIADDHAARSPKRQVVILLGDLVDRGPDSAGVMDRACRLSESGIDVRMLAGNHEELLALSCQGDERALKIFAQNGGKETALSYGIADAAYTNADYAALQSLLVAAIPPEHRALVDSMEDMVVIGDYVFVHAGIRPGIPLAQQSPDDLRWIRERFLQHAGPHEKFVVHGHTIAETVDERPNRLGIDTGAYLSGRLSAVALEGDRRWFLST